MAEMLIIAQWKINQYGDSAPDNRPNSTARAPSQEPRARGHPAPTKTAGAPPAAGFGVLHGRAVTRPVTRPVTYMV